VKSFFLEMVATQSVTARLSSTRVMSISNILEC